LASSVFLWLHCILVYHLIIILIGGGGGL